MKPIRSFLLAIVIAAGAEVARVNGGRAYAQVSLSETVDGAPYNLVITVLDASGSFRVPSRAPGLKGKVLADEGLRIVQQFFRDAGNQKRRRGERPDMYYIIAIDGASQIVWSGTHDELSKLTPQELERKLALRQQFANCTDIELAMNEVASIIGKHPDAEAYVLTFSDLLHEPTQQSWKKCAAPSGEPPRSIDWKTLSGAHLGFYFVSKEFPHRPDTKWKREIERRGLQADFFDAAQALSAGVTLSPPPPAVYKPTQQQVDKARTAAASLTNIVVSGAVVVAIVFIGGIVGLFAWVSRARRNAVPRGTAR